jgi:hypothetical protein
MTTRTSSEPYHPVKINVLLRGVFEKRILTKYHPDNTLSASDRFADLEQ